jgi:acyl carrier protein
LTSVKPHQLCHCYNDDQGARLASPDLTATRAQINQRLTRMAQQGDCTMASTFETVADIISSSSDVPLENIKPDSHVMKDLEIDSLAFLDITFEIDKTFGIQLPVEDWLSEVNEGKRNGDDYFVLQNLCSLIDAIRGEAVA